MDPLGKTTRNRNAWAVKEIETDRRIIRDRISLLKKLAKIDTQKSTQRQNRGSLCAWLCGIYQWGKSTLMNLLSDADVFAENKLLLHRHNRPERLFFKMFLFCYPTRSVLFANCRII